PASIDPLVPVLRDNFWLTIHVLTITLSYAAFLLACAFGHILLFRYARNPRGARADAPMHFWLYRVLQLGVLLLAAGTILGGESYVGTFVIAVLLFVAFAIWRYRSSKRSPIPREEPVATAVSAAD